MLQKRIRDLREDNDLMQKDLANYLMVTQCTYSSYELGRLNISIEIVKKLAAYYDTSIDYLVGLTDEQKPYPKPTRKKPCI